MKVASVFTDHMVLQRGKPIRVFGEAEGMVRVRLAGAEEIVSAREGRFVASLPAMEAGGPYELHVECGAESVTLSDVMIGEVWLCGGQSNMEFRLKDELHGAEAIAKADHPLIRFYETPVAARVDEDLWEQERQRTWIRQEPGACGDVSAVAFYAAQELAVSLGVAVGMVICCLGGSSASCWMSREALAAFPEGQAYLDEFEDRIAGKSEEQYAREEAEYQRAVSAYCEAQDVLQRAEPGLSRTEIESRIGCYPWPPPFGRWMLRRPAGMYETMLSRLMPLSVRGVLFYQGEEDANLVHAKDYAEVFGRMMKGWRSGFEDETLWFVAAQLPLFGADSSADWPAIRAAQQMACDRDGRAALACLIDCGEWDDIHPREKQTPGVRMARLALRHAYGQSVEADAPRLADMRLEGETLVLRMAHTGGGLRLTDPGALRLTGAQALEAVTAGDEVRVRFSGTPVAVSYAQENAPKAALFGTNGLPVFPFSVTL